MTIPVVRVLVLPLHPDRGERHQSSLTPPPFRHTVTNSNPLKLCFPNLIFQALTATHDLSHHAPSYTVKKPFLQCSNAERPLPLLLVQRRWIPAISEREIVSLGNSSLWPHLGFRI